MGTPAPVRGESVRTHCALRVTHEQKEKVRRRSWSRGRLRGQAAWRLVWFVSALALLRVVESRREDPEQVWGVSHPPAPQA